MSSDAALNVVARPRSLFTFAFDCFDEQEEVVASFQHRAFHATGTIIADGVEYVVQRAGTGLVVRPAGSEKVVVTIASEGRGRMALRWDGRTLELARSGIGFRMVLVSKRGVVGKLGLRDLFGRTMILDSDEPLPPHVIGALFWMAVARRRQLLMVGRG